MKKARAKKPRKVRPWTPAWFRMAADYHLPEVHPCADCHGPVKPGWICPRCGSDNPGRNGHSDWTSP